ncbi:sensor histidine kinase [Natronoglomus mannanivorans]|uniref:histidine kinase n=1 Tax=Natronoglomus mannanivorans TaxID=2979990 RepID=A0AAP2Z3Y0_9EURY|nr:ATP-binding protein [Halobacteria archaeon AArc-xg1-1]
MSIVPTSHNHSIVAVLVVFSFVGGSGLVLLVGGYRLSRTEIHPRFHTAILWRSLAGIGVMLAILGLYHVQPDTGLTNPTRSIPILTGFSAVAGFAVGLSDGRAKTRAHALEQKNRQLERVQEQLEASNERLEQFAYAASHDLQEPLRMVSSYLQLIDGRYGDDLDDDGEEFLAYAIDGADRMKEMIDGLLEYSRIDTQGEPFAPVDLDEVLAAVRKDLELKIEETDAAIEADALPRVHGDERQLRQLFQNLVSNAIQYSPSAPRVEITTERDGDEWVVSVHDDGIGIDSAEQERIFEVFQRLHGPDERPGTGLGLALCRRIVERHGGEIWVESEPHEGSTFSFTLPVEHDRHGPRPLDDRGTVANP